MARLLIFPNFCTCSLLAVAVVVCGLPVLGAAAVGAGDGRCCYWYRSASSLVVTSPPGQSVSYSFAQSSTDCFFL